VGLILAEQTLLIALDDGRGRDTTRWGTDAGLAGALLLDLARLQLLDTGAGDTIVAREGTQPGHELLRDVYAKIRNSSRPRSAQAWVEPLPRELKPLRQRVARGLVQRGVLSEEHSKMLGVLPATRFPTADPAPERDLRQRLRDVLLADREPAEEEALLVGLLEPLGLIDSIVPKDRRKDARKRAKAVAEHGLTGTAVRDAIRAVQATVIAAIVASTVVSAN
jgi:Golgi phosphoprotein 3 (GPP34)